MNDNAKKWVAALRSGEYKQTNYALHVPEDYMPLNDGGGYGDLTPGYCCLGVACVLYQEEVGDLNVERRPYNPVSYDGEMGGLPSRVWKWLGMHNGLGLLNGTSLASKNDSEKLTFSEIADWIEENPALFESSLGFEENASA